MVQAPPGPSQPIVVPDVDLVPNVDPVADVAADRTVRPIGSSGPIPTTDDRAIPTRSSRPVHAGTVRAIDTGACR